MSKKVHSSLWILLPSSFTSNCHHHPHNHHHHPHHSPHPHHHRLHRHEKGDLYFIDFIASLFYVSLVFANKVGLERKIHFFAEIENNWKFLIFVWQESGNFQKFHFFFG